MTTATPPQTTQDKPQITRVESLEHLAQLKDQPQIVVEFQDGSGNVMPALLRKDIYPTHWVEVRLAFRNPDCIGHFATSLNGYEVVDGKIRIKKGHKDTSCIFISPASGRHYNDEDRLLREVHL